MSDAKKGVKGMRPRVRALVGLATGVGWALFFLGY